MARYRSLKGKLLLSISVLIVASGLGISFLVSYRYSQVLYAAATTHAENIAHQIVLQAGDQILANDLAALQKLIDHHLKSHPALSYLFILKDGEILAHSFSGGLPVTLIEGHKAASGGAGSTRKVQTQDGEDLLDFTQPILGGRAGVLRLGVSEQPLRQKVNRLWRQMLLVTAGILCAGIFAVYWFIRRFTGPLSTLAKASEEITDGRMDVHVPVSGQDEVALLTSSFNRMAIRIKDYTRRLEEKTAELDRAHQQTRNSFAIVQEVGTQRNLNDVCTYLMRKFQGVVACQQMAMLVFLEDKKSLMMVSANKSVCLEGAHFEAVRSVVGALEKTAFLEPDRFSPPLVPPEFSAGRSLVLTPVRHEGLLFGALLIACGGECACDRKGLDVISLIFRQTAGTIRRAALQETEIRGLQERVEATAEFSGIIGKDPQMRMVYKLIEDTAPSDATVLIQGESGTGKELVAKAIHHLSARRDKPFVVINCSAYPATLLESELFGHEKGAFTGAVRQKTGRFEQADCGTVFLDEIGEIQLSAQLKLLRVIQTQKFERLGAEKTLGVDVRIIAATNKDLLEEVKRGEFREDLYYRLNVILIQLPPLRDRRNDIPLLARHFLRHFAVQQAKEVQEFSSEAMRMLLDYSWPGNVRELENSIEHALVLSKGKQIEATDLPPVLQTTKKPQKTRSPRTIIDSEKKLLQETLEECGWNKKLAARHLGISRSTLYSKIKKLQIMQPTIH